MNEGKYRLAAFEAVEDGLLTGEVARLQVRGGSMRPTLKAGDWVLVEGGMTLNLDLGDIIVVKRAQDVVTHRVVGKRGKYWVTKGDASYYADPHVKPEAVLGRVIRLQRGGSTTDLTTRRRKLVHRWVARLSSLEGKMFQQAINIQRRVGKSHRNTWIGYLLKAAISPLRLLVRLFAP